MNVRSPSSHWWGYLRGMFRPARVRSGLRRVLDTALRPSFGRVFPGFAAGEDELVIQPAKRKQRQGTRPLDFVVPSSMAQAKRAGVEPASAVEHLHESAGDDLLSLVDLCQAQTGFLGLRVRDDAAVRILGSVCNELSVGRDAAPVEGAPSVLLDYASPNMCKELHAGHLRSSVLGDTLAALFEDAGWRVTRVSHLGDWGTPVCTVVTHLMESGNPPSTTMPASALSAHYVEAKKRLDSDSAFAARLHQNVALLHSLATQFLHAGGGQDTHRRGDAEFPVDVPCGSMEHCDAFSADSERADKLWRTWCAVHDSSVSAVDDVLARLRVRVRHVGESSYATAVAGAVGELQRLGMLETRGGAGVVYLRRDEHGRPVEAGSPEERFVLLQRRGGGNLYATTDVATARWRASRGYAAALYLVDGRQKQHFQDVFALVERAGWTDATGTRLLHVPFGLVRGEDGAKLSSREGTDLTLEGLLEGAYEAARRSLDSSAFWEDVVGREGAAETSREKDEVASAIARSSLRYFELAHNRTRDYTADFERMVAAKGNTAVSLMYAVARIKAILRKADHEGCEGRDLALAALEGHAPGPWPALQNGQGSEEGEGLDDASRALVLTLTQYPDALDQTLRHLSPHVLTEHLYATAASFHAFYGACPVLGSGPHERFRLWLCAATAHVLQHGMDLVGVKVVDRM